MREISRENSREKGAKSVKNVQNVREREKLKEKGSRNASRSDN